MTKKKSYMDKSNILSESKLLKLISKLIPVKSIIKKAFSSKKEKDALKNPEVKKAITNFITTYSVAMKNAEEAAQRADNRYERWLKKTKGK
jgi:hypothetical protein